MPSAARDEATRSRDFGAVTGVTAVVMTKNEAVNIRKCLHSLESFSQVIVVDSASSDDTVEIANNAGAEVVDFVWNGEYPKKKQWCLDNLTFRNEWVLYVDADEEVPAELQQEIAETISQTRHAGYFVAYDYVFMGKPLRHGRVIRKLILLNRHQARFPVRDDLGAENMWEVEGHYQPEISGSVGVLKSHMVHDDRSSLYDFFERHNRYSDWEAAVYLNAGRRAGPEANWRVRLAKRIYDRLPGKPLATFLYIYAFRMGWRDGRAGLDYCIAMAFYAWQISLKRRERLDYVD